MSMYAAIGRSKRLAAVWTCSVEQWATRDKRPDEEYNDPSQDHHESGSCNGRDPTSLGLSTAGQPNDEEADRHGGKQKAECIAVDGHGLSEARLQPPHLVG